MLPQMPPEWVFDREGGRLGARRGFDHGYQDGYDWMQLGHESGWHALSSWGADGWDLGDWPYVCYMVRQEAEALWLIERCEGDLQLWQFADRDALYALVDEIAERGWRFRHNGPTDIDSFPLGRLPENYRGPYRRSEVAQ